MEQLLALPGTEAPYAARARVLQAAGQFAMYSTDYATGRSALKESVALWRGLGELRRLGRTLSLLVGLYGASSRAAPAILAEAEGATTEARKNFLAALPLAHEGGVRSLTSQALFGAGFTALADADTDRARSYFVDALIEAWESQHLGSVAVALIGVVIVA
ncbi:MAG: hypothetical protein ACR2PL_05845 [Dehalococcoidia bacterium]